MTKIGNGNSPFDSAVIVNDASIGGDLILDGNLVFVEGGKIESTDSTDIELAPNGTGKTISSKPVDIYNVMYAYNYKTPLGGYLSYDGFIGFIFPSFPAQTKIPVGIQLGALSRTLLICADGISDFCTVTENGPTIRLQSNSGVVSEHIRIQHNETDGTIDIGKGGFIHNHGAPVSLEDDASFVLPDGSHGFGFFMIGDNEEYAHICWDSSAQVTLISGSANIALADSDGFFCFVDSGTQVTVKNRLGAAREVMFHYDYSV